MFIPLQYVNKQYFSRLTNSLLQDFGSNTKEKASEMLHKLSGRKHVVISGYTLISKEKEITRTVRTYVYFNKLSDELIEKYIATGSPMDKAGAYGIQDKEFDLVNHIEGSFDNVIGLPTEDLKQHWF